MIESLVNVILVVLVALSSMGFGSYVLHKAGYLNGPVVEGISLSLGLGLVALVYSMAALGGLHYFYPTAAWSLMAVFGLLGILSLRCYQARQLVVILKITGSFSRLDWLLVLIIGAMGLAYLIVALSPTLESDSLFGHLVIPREYARQHALLVVDHAYGTTFPQNAQLISTFGFLLRGQILAQLLVSWLPGVLSLAAVYALGRTFVPLRSRLIAIIVWYGTYSMSYLATSAKLDVAWSAFDLLGLLAFSNWYFANRDDRHWRWLILAGIFFGTAGGVKSVSLFTVIVLSLAVAVRLWRDNQRRPARWMAAYLALGVPSATLAGVWVVRTFILTDGIGWTGSDLPGYNSVWGFFQVLWEMSMMGNAPTFEGALGKSIGPAILATLPLLLLFRQVSPKIKHILVFCGLMLVLWFLGVQRARHLLPTLGLLAILAGYVVAQLISQRRYIGYFALTLLMVSVILSLGRWTYINFVSLQRVDYVMGLQDVNGYLETNLRKLSYYPNYSIMVFTRKHLPMDARIVALSDDVSYYLDRTLYGIRSDYLSFSGSWADTPADVPEPERFARRLEIAGITHVFINASVVEARELSDAWLSNLEFQEKYMDRLICAEGQCLYELR